MVGRGRGKDVKGGAARTSMQSLHGSKDYSRKRISPIERMQSNGSENYCEPNSRKKISFMERMSLVDEDETQPPDDWEENERVDENLPTTGNKDARKGRGRYKSIKVDMKTHGGRSKLQVNMPQDIERVVGDNARDLVNYCGFIVRTNAPLNVKNWKEVYEKTGESMWMHVKDRFEFPENEERLKAFIVTTMRRLYKGWKNRLHVHYKQYASDRERLENKPIDMQLDQWLYCIQYFGSQDFKIISQRNSANAKKRKQIHTTGNVSFAEIEERMVDPISGEKPTVQDIWFYQHAHKTKEGNLEWADNRSKEIGDKLKSLVEKSSQEGATPMTKEDMYDEAMGVRSGYRRGFGYGKKGFTKRVCVSQYVQKDNEQEVSKLRDTVAELREKLDNFEADRVAREERIRREIQNQVRDELRRDFMQMNFPSFQFTESEPVENN